MEASKELNSELKAQINKRFEDLFKEIGNNRQQLAAKVLEVHRNINKELSKEKVDEKRQNELLAEVSKIERIAAQQLPHILRKPMPGAPPKPVAPKATVAKPASPAQKQTPKKESPKVVRKEAKPEKVVAKKAAPKKVAKKAAKKKK
jgi:hypothetical protein